jgi:arylsulfatase A-like enzyme
MTYTHENRHTAYYADKELPCFPREPVHPWLKQNRSFIGDPVSMRGYASAVSGVDDGVGAILDTMGRNGLDDDTLVIFCSDQGLCGGHHGMWGMGDHSRPIHTYEETMHIPLIFRHTGSIPEGTVFEERTCNYDFFPSMLDYLDMADALPSSPALPGTSYARAMRGEQILWGDTFFHEFENVRMIRNDRWKYTWRFPDGPDELYDMQSDPGETQNLANDIGSEAVIREMREQIAAFFMKYADPQYDVWRGGRSKAGRII